METKQDTETLETTGRVELDDIKPFDEPYKDLTASESKKIQGGQGTGTTQPPPPPPDPKPKPGSGGAGIGGIPRVI